MGINVGVRIEDLIKLKVEYVFGRHISLAEAKCGKERTYLVNTQLRKGLEGYKMSEGLQPHTEHLFQEP